MSAIGCVRDDDGATGATGATGVQTMAVGIREAYRKYVAFHSDHEAAQSGVMTLWTLHMWTFTDELECTPYILVTAPTSAAGKSRVFDVARLLVRKPYTVTDPTPASLYRAIDERCPTLMIDEADMLRENRSLRNVLNAGFQPGSPIPRAGKSGGDFKVFCPKIFSGITNERPPITSMTLSRCIQVHLRRRGPREHITHFYRPEASRELLPLRQAAEKWALGVSSILAGSRPEDIPDDLPDRQQDMWMPLLAIADMIGPNWGRTARQWAVELHRAIPAEPVCAGATASVPGGTDPHEDAGQ